MSPVHQRLDLSDRVPEQPGFDPGKALKAKPGPLLLRFAAGAATSVVSGILALLFGPRIGGIPLAFPAVLVASLTLIEEQEDSEEAREDSRGAMAGAAAMAVFGVVGGVLFEVLPGGVVLVLAAAAWLLVAVGLYGLLWWKRRPG
ncbi:MAG TPA: DUF3147 family protein [Solirubrobacteraceae bacterium]|jgi:hypothetical protein|nr:DUF3147 family protein [Solirubrobacteraceae bacterium]